jgi:hypothetical protein
MVQCMPEKREMELLSMFACKPERVRWREREGECAAAGSSPLAVAGGVVLPCHGATVPRPDLWRDSASHVSGQRPWWQPLRAAMHGAAWH